MAQDRVDLFMSAFLHLWVEYHRKHERLDRNRGLKENGQIKARSIKKYITDRIDTPLSEPSGILSNRD